MLADADPNFKFTKEKHLIRLLVNLLEKGKKQKKAHKLFRLLNFRET